MNKLFRKGRWFWQCVGLIAVNAFLVGMLIAKALEPLYAR
jgi:hypothetical protein